MKIFGFDSRYVRTALVASFVAAVSLGAFAQDAASSSTPAAAIGYFPYSTITSANDTIYATQLPVTYNGKTYYEDATILLSFEVNATTGEVTATAAPSFVKSPPVPTNHFKPGTYVGPSNINGGKNIIVVSGPSSLPGGGSEWTLALGSSANAATYPSTANWYVVSTLSNNPGYSRLKAAGITSTDYSYGIGDSGSSPNGDWPGDAILGFSQVGNTLSISSFSSCCDYYDHSTPTDTITYTYQQP